MVAVAALAGRVPAMVVAELGRLSDAEQAAWLEEFERRAKSPVAGLVCAVLGLHYAYLGRWGLQVLYWATLGGFFVWWFVDLFRAAGLVRDANQDVAIAALRDLKALQAA